MARKQTKTIPVSPDIHKEVLKLKIRMGANNCDEIIKPALDLLKKQLQSQNK